MALTLPHLPARDASRSSTSYDAGLHFEKVARAATRDPAVLRARGLELWHLASLDAPTVAIVWTLGFAWAAGVRLAAWIPLLIALTVWAVYIFDRLLDTRGALRTAEMERLRERHYFHWRHRHILLPLGAVAAGAAGWLIFAFMPLVARERDSVLAAASFAYFARVHAGHRSRPFLSSLLTKELLVGTLFTAGCALPAFGALWLDHAALWPLAGAAAVFTSLAWLNCHAIDRWESQKDEHTGMPLAGCGCLIALSGAAATAAAWAHPRFVLLLAAAAVSALLLALLDRGRGRLSPVTLRAAADLALLAPAPLLAAAWLMPWLAR